MVIYYGHIRVTGDVDFYYELTSTNADNLYLALKDFWNGDVPGVGSKSDLLQKGIIIQFGRPPCRIDIINYIDDVDFKQAWQSKAEVVLHYKSKLIPVYFIGLELLIKNKKAINRPKDIDDLNYLQKL